MLRRSLRSVVGAMVIVIALASCGTSKAGYGGATLAVFMKACDPTGAGGDRALVCRCTYDQIQQRYTYAQYSAMDARLQTDPSKIPDEINRIIGGCAFSVSLGRHPATASSSSPSPSSSSPSSSS